MGLYRCDSAISVAVPAALTAQALAWRHAADTTPLSAYHRHDAELRCFYWRKALSYEDSGFETLFQWIEVDLPEAAHEALGSPFHPLGAPMLEGFRKGSFIDPHRQSGRRWVWSLELAGPAKLTLCPASAERSVPLAIDHGLRLAITGEASRQ